MRAAVRWRTFVLRSGKLLGLLAISDPIKASTEGALRALREDGLRIVMLTGDAPATAHSVARELGIQEVIAGVLPDQKAQEIRRLQGEGRVVGMAGDGVNDAPALAIFGVSMSPMLAAAAMSLSSVSVIANALRLRHAGN